MSSAIRLCLGVVLFALTFALTTGQQLHADSKQQEDSQTQEENAFSWFTTGYGFVSLQHYYSRPYPRRELQLRGIVGAKLLNTKLDASLTLGLDMPSDMIGVRLAWSELALQFTAYDNNTVALFPYLIVYVDPSRLGKLDGLAGEFGFVAQVNRDIDTRLGKINIGAKSDLYGSDAGLEGIFGSVSIWSSFMPVMAKSKLEIVVSSTYSATLVNTEPMEEQVRLRPIVDWRNRVDGMENRIGISFAITDNLLISNDFAFYLDGFFAGWAGDGLDFVNVAKISYDLF